MRYSLAFNKGGRMFSLSRVLFFSVAVMCLVTTPGSVTGNALRAERPVKHREWTREAKVWTARSCVGEAGFDAIDECMAIAWVYATRATESGMDYLKVVKRYSAALKQHSSHRRPWILQLDESLEKPEDWPNLRWGVHKHLWKNLLVSLDRWARGNVPNPVPNADHYGSKADATRARYVKRWKKLKTPGFRNWFFNSRIKEEKENIAWSEAEYWESGYWLSTKETMKKGRTKGVLLRPGEIRYGNLIIDKSRNVR